MSTQGTLSKKKRCCRKVRHRCRGDFDGAYTRDRAIDPQQSGVPKLLGLTLSQNKRVVSRADLDVTYHDCDSALTTTKIYIRPCAETIIT